MKNKVIKNEKGSALIAFVIGFLLFIITIFSFLQLFPLYDEYSRLNDFGKEIMRTAEFSGQVGVETDAEIVRMKAITNLNPDITWNRTGKIALGEKIEVTLKMESTIRGFGKDFVIPMTVKITGRSEVYWK